MEILQRIWQENRDFIIKAGSGFVIFLFLRGCVVNTFFFERAERTRISNSKTETEVSKLRSEVVSRLPQEEKNLEEFSEIEKDLLVQCLTPPPASVPDPKLGAPQIQFSQRIDAIWTELQSKANRKNFRIPPKITPADLGVGAADTPEDLQRESAYLQLLGRALHSCVDSGMVAIDKIQIFPQEDWAIRGNEMSALVYDRVSLTVQGPFTAYRDVLQDFQGPGKTAQVRLVSLDSKGAGGVNALRGQIEFVGLQMLTASQGETDKPPDAPEKKPKRKRRK